MRRNRGAFRLTGAGLLLTMASFATPAGAIGWLIGLITLIVGLLILFTGIYAFFKPEEVRQTLESILDECEAYVRFHLAWVLQDDAH